MRKTSCGILLFPMTQFEVGKKHIGGPYYGVAKLSSVLINNSKLPPIDYEKILAAISSIIENPFCPPLKPLELAVMLEDLTVFSFGNPKTISLGEGSTKPYEVRHDLVVGSIFYADLSYSISQSS